MTRLIKRYANRKLYDTQSSRYVTLEGIADLVRSGDDVRIIDNDSGEDLTAVTFAQILFEEQKRENPLLGLPVLRWIIQQGGAAIQEIASSVDRGREALENVRELAERGVKQFAQGGETRHPEKTAHDAKKRGIFEEILELPQRQIEQLQHRIDTQVRGSIERVASHPAVKHELQRIEKNLRQLEQQISSLGRGKPPPPKKRAAKTRKVKSNGRSSP